MSNRGLGVRWAGLSCALLVAASSFASAQSDTPATYNASVSVFSGVTHTRVGERQDTTGSLGIQGAAGGRVSSGAHALTGRYSATAETRRQDLVGDNNDSINLVGASRYDFGYPAGRFDFNAGHTVRGVRNDTGFLVDLQSYDVQHAVNAGFGLNFWPTNLTTLRLSGQTARTFEEKGREDGESYSAQAALTRRWSQRTTIGATVGSNWSGRNSEDTTVDTAQLTFEQRLSNGSFSLAAGQSRARQRELEVETTTGNARRTWSSSQTTSAVYYDRSVSSTVLDLALGPLPAELADLGLPESIRIQELNLRETVGATVSTRRFCSLCRVSFLAEASSLEAQRQQLQSYEYRGRLGLSVDATPDQTVDLSYSWQGDAADKASELTDQVHRVGLGWRRTLTEHASVSASASQGFTRGETNREQFAARLSFTYGVQGALY